MAEDAMAREQRYLALEERVRTELDASLIEDALAALKRCPRRTGIPPLSSYYCECPMCVPSDWFIGDE